jgi:hypothetical protein
MQQPLPTQPSPAASSFVGLLATLTAPKPAAPEDESLWSASDLGEDVVSLSYERALRAHGRYRPGLGGNGLPMRSTGAGTDTAAGEPIGTDVAMARPKADAAPEFSKMGAPSSAPDCDLRTASVTIRLSKVECARLRERAAEAGLTISAYLRSCALEAETLRAEVKKTLAELKRAAETAPPVAQTRRPWLGWIAQFFTR